jgi:hypothetical protein
MNNLDEILCLDSKLYSKYTSYQQKFEKLIYELMHNTILKINQTEYRIA